MKFNKTQISIISVFVILTSIFCLLVSVTLGFALGSAEKTQKAMTRKLENFKPALPTQIFDRKGRFISEFFGDQNRKLISISNIPNHLIFALLSREDKNFYNHSGFDFLGFSRAFLARLVGQNRGGGSTLTQQIAGKTFCNRNEITYRRKIVELWYALNMEKYYSKAQILELYANDVALGYGTNGFEAACQFYFDKSVSDISVAEAAILVPSLSNPSFFNPIKGMEQAKARQIEVLKKMVKKRYVTKNEADISFDDYWKNYNYTKFINDSAYESNEKQAPYFSEYVRIQLTKMLYGTADIYTDGYKVYTTLDLDYQKVAEDAMEKGIKRINQDYQWSSIGQSNDAKNSVNNLLSSMAVVFNIPALAERGSVWKIKTEEKYDKTINPILHMLSLMSSEQITHNVSLEKSLIIQKREKREFVEGAFICLDNNTGNILAMVGGSDFSSNEMNRATNAKVSPGSALKPLYYAEGIRSKKFTAASYLSDTPRAYITDAGEVYTPNNYGNLWQGGILLRQALARSLNIPSIDVLNAVGFEPAIEMMSKLLGNYNQRFDERLYPRVLPLALGITQTSPMAMARAFATFANLGQANDPIAILKVKDRNGKTIIDNEKIALKNRQKNPSLYNVMKPEDAYVMTEILKSTFTSGTLMHRYKAHDKFNNMPVAGKTGTTDNWGDAWACGYTPYMTTSIWFGFDYPGISLGKYITGASHAGEVLSQYIEEIHKQLPIKEFDRPKDGGYGYAPICSRSGLKPSANCKHIINEVFTYGTFPDKVCSMCETETERDILGLHKIETAGTNVDINFLLRNDDESEESIALEELRKKYFTENELSSIDEERHNDFINLRDMEVDESIKTRAPAPVKDDTPIIIDSYIKVDDNITDKNKKESEKTNTENSSDKNTKPFKIPQGAIY